MANVRIGCRKWCNQIGYSTIRGSHGKRKFLFQHGNILSAPLDSLLIYNAENLNLTTYLQ